MFFVYGIDGNVIGFKLFNNEVGKLVLYIDILGRELFKINGFVRIIFN